MTTLSAHGLHVHLGPQAVLKGIDLEIGADAVIGLIGPNGAGKTTLLRSLLGLIAAERGRVCLDGRNILAVPAAERARSIAYLPQGGTVAWSLCVSDVVSLGRLPFEGRGTTPHAAGTDPVERAMAATGVSHLGRRNVHELSGGERARVMLARALAGDPAVLLADEPVAALDPYHQLAVMELLVSRARSGRAVIVVMHDLALAARFCDRLILLDEGRVVGDGPPATVLGPAALAATYKVEAVMGQHEGALTILPWRRLDGRGDDGARHGKGMP